MRSTLADLRRYDFSAAKVVLIYSFPGYHKGKEMNRVGHLQLRSVLKRVLLPAQYISSPILTQASSIGSLTEKWLDKEFAASLSPSVPAPIKIIWPTVESVRVSLEGYAAGGSLPLSSKNNHSWLKDRFFARYDCEHNDRKRVTPHMKSYCRFSGQSFPWFLLTSSNMSKAAWGEMQKGESQLCVRNYEIGVLFIPEALAQAFRKPHVSFSCTPELQTKRRAISPDERVDVVLDLAPRFRQGPSSSVGCIVMIQGLRSKPELNGLEGTISSFDPCSQRF